MSKTAYVPVVEKHSVVFGQACRRFLTFSLRVVEYGNVYTKTNNPHGERFSHLQRLNYILEGNPFYTCCGKRVDLEPGSLVFLPANMTLGGVEGETVRLMFINFELGALDARDDFYAFMDSLFPYNHVHDRDDELKNIMLEIQRVGALNQLGVALEIQNLFENLFLHVVRMSQRYGETAVHDPLSGGDAIINTAMGYINANLHRPFRVSEMAEKLNISENYLYKIFLRQTGKSPAEFIADVRIESARSALSNLNLPIKTIAYSLGYTSAAHFSNTFKKAVGLSPAAYRKQLVQGVLAENSTAVLRSPPPEP